MTKENSKENNSVIKAVLFDVDGTLVDSNDLHIESWQIAFRQYGKEIDRKAIQEQMGKGGDQLLPVFLTKEEVEEFGEKLEKYRSDLFIEKYLPQVKPFPKVHELFERIHNDGLQIALASSSKDKEIETHTKNLKIGEYLDTKTSSDDAEKSKPQPDIFEAALEKLSDVKPSEAVVIGDTPYDAIAAGKAGIRTIAVLSGGFGEDVLREARAIEVYQDVADILAHYDESLLAKGQAKTKE